jgi:D-galactose 1-dehydrogenase
MGLDVSRSSAGTEAPIRIAIVGLGKIARDQHIPALRANARYTLAAVVTSSPAASIDVPTFGRLGELIEAMPEVQAVTFCTPPQGRCFLAREALDAGLHVMLEKPPGVTVSEAEGLIPRAQEKSVALFASWHSRAAGAVEAARKWLAQRRIHKVAVNWKEDVRKWHPGQQWIWQPGGLGVFDPGINALSVITRLLPRPLFVRAATLLFPSNRDTPIAADLTLGDDTGLGVEVAFDFRQTGDECWDVSIQTDAGTLELRRGGALLQIDGKDVSSSSPGEYPLLYQHFANLVATRTSDVDLAPLRLVADAFLLGRRVVVEPFED